MAIGSVAPAGPLQQAMRHQSVPTFALGAASRAAYPLALARLVSLLRRPPGGAPAEPVLLHAHCFDPTLLGLVAARLARVPFVFTRHHSDHHVRPGKWGHVRLDAWCGRRADHVIAVSQAARRVMTEIEAVPSEHITVVHNGMEPLPVPEARRVAALRRELGLGSDPVLLVPARLHEEKGHRYLLEALPAVRERCGPVSLLLAGGGPHRGPLEEEARRRGVAGCVRFLGFRRDVPELMSLAAVVVLPSLAESFGYAALEALSLGRPVVATTAGGLPEVVEAETSGLLVPPADAPALADAICRVLREPDLASRLAAAGPSRAAAFPFTAMIREYENVYRRVLARHGVCPPSPS